MVTGTLFTYPESHRAYKILIAAGYSGADVKVDPNFEFGKTNATTDFLKKFPLGQVPAFEDGSGICLAESNAIAFYVANETLRGGSNAVDQALVQEYISFAENEILPSACTWTFPTLGFKQYNKQETEKAINHVKKCMSLLNDFLLTRTFLVGERVTLADIAVCCSLLTLYVQVFDDNFREPYGNVNRWFTTCINQPIFKNVIGDVKLCEKMAVFDSKRYNELHPKKGKEPKPKQEKKEEKPKEVAAEAPAPKKKIDYFADVPKSDFIMDTWKKMYSNNEVEVSLPWLWEHFDPKAYSFWYCEYKYPEEQTLEFLATNAVNGFFQRIEGLHKHSFGVINICKETKGHSIRGVWLHRGLKNAFFLNPDWSTDAEHYNFRQLDHNNAEDKKIIEGHCAGEGEFFGENQPVDYKCFK
ncbi:elongation factor 1-gamma-A-like [Hydractinia symbiolongicarpus]|uniref:elongation factor 1-gamma-A-like n=1 Tax=Hydractinia symbiolongicarpus TaxID=13093 RepID=UPI00254D6A3B|nr:elongation factor 1-gamma-A-like [Hydractinia symbiolongicarpus]